jgi:hypothetical protein
MGVSWGTDTTEERARATAVPSSNDPAPLNCTGTGPKRQVLADKHVVIPRCASLISWFETEQG